MSNTRPEITRDRKLDLAKALETVLIDNGFVVSSGYMGLVIRDIMTDSKWHELHVTATGENFFESLSVKVGEVDN